MEGICGFFFYVGRVRQFLPQVKLQAHAEIVSSAARTTLQQTFVSPAEPAVLPEVTYSFPLFAGVSVVAFRVTIGDRVITGEIQERKRAQATYDKAVSQGRTAALLARDLASASVFSTTVGNVPANSEVRMELTFVGELKHDLAANALRYTLPTRISPRYGAYPGANVPKNPREGSSLELTLDVNLPELSPVASISSPSHTVEVHIGRLAGAPAGAPMAPGKAHVKLAQGTVELHQDVVVLVAAEHLGDPVAVVETHPTIEKHRALMLTLVPQFRVPQQEAPEVMFLCDRSGSMDSGNRMRNLRDALQVFLRALPTGSTLNVCSFGSQHEFLWHRSQPYTQSTLDEASRHVAGFSANFGGTEMLDCVRDALARRDTARNQEIFLMTDGEVWQEQQLCEVVRAAVQQSNGAVRVFTLGIGASVSHSLIEGVAEAGNGLAQTVADNEKLDVKALRMLRAALSPHITSASLTPVFGSTHTSEDPPKPPSDKPATAAASAPPVVSLFDPSVLPEPAAAAAAAGNQAAGAAAKDLLAATAGNVPAVVKAPARVSQLFPFSRATLYALLSEAAPAVPVTSVVLTATIGGTQPQTLRLEVPVVCLDGPSKDETEAEKKDFLGASAVVHQLAAIRAVRDLETGGAGGWIGADAALKKALEQAGCYAEALEAEAVRIALRFQVLSKGCSFVAVGEVVQVEAAEERPQRGWCQTKNERIMQESCPVGPFYFDEAEDEVQERRAVQPAATEFCFSHKRKASSDRGRKVKTKATKRGQRGDSAEGQPAVDAAAGPFAVLVQAQAFDGRWPAAHAAFWTAIGTTLPAVRKLLPANLGGRHDERDDVVATVAALAFLGARLLPDKDTWVLLADKAEAWVAARVAQPVGDLVRQVAVLFPGKA